MIDRTGRNKKTGQFTRYWTKERVIQEATRYASRQEWSKKSPGSYTAAKRGKLLDDPRIVLTLGPSRKRNRDNLYITCSEEENLYKIGVTDLSPHKRIFELNKKCKANLVYVDSVKTNMAYCIEQTLLFLGTPVRLNCSGGTEFRQFNDEELNIIFTIFSQLH